MDFIIKMLLFFLMNIAILLLIVMALFAGVLTIDLIVTLITGQPLHKWLKHVKNRR